MRNFLLAFALGGVALGGIACGGSSPTDEPTVNPPKAADIRVVATLEGAVVSPGPVAIDTTTHKVYVSDFGGGLLIIDGLTHAVSFLYINPGTMGVAVDSGRGRAYVVSYFEQKLAVVDLAIPQVVDHLSPGTSQPWQLAFDPGTQTAYVTVSEGASIIAFDVSRNVKKAIGLGGGQNPGGIDVDPLTHHVYVASSDDTVAVVDGTRNTLLANVPVGAGSSSVAVNTETGIVYSADDKDKTVSVVDGRTNTRTATIPLGHLPGGIAVDPTTHAVYVSNNDDSSVTVIDGTRNTVITTVAVGARPAWLAVDPGTHKVFVPSGKDKTVSVIATVP